MESSQRYFLEFSLFWFGWVICTGRLDFVVVLPLVDTTMTWLQVSSLLLTPRKETNCVLLGKIQRSQCVWWDSRDKTIFSNVRPTGQ